MKYADKLLLLTICLLAGLMPARAQRFEWGRILTGSGTTVNSTVDAAGNSYLFGTFRGQLTLGSTTITSPSPAYSDLFVAKYDAAGNLRWLRQAGSTSTEAIASIATDGGGNLYVAGTHGAGLAFGALSLGYAGHFLARLDTATGYPVWLKRLEGSATSGSIVIRALATDAAGDCYLTGSATAINSFDLWPLQNPGTRPNALVAKCGRGGTIQWVTQVLEDTSGPVTAGLFRAEAIGVNSGGELAIGGTFRGRFKSGQGPNLVTLASSDTIASNRDAFVLRFAPHGTPRWVHLGAGQDNQVVNGVALDDFGNTYVTGGAARAFSFSPGVNPALGVFLARFSATGHIDWLRGQSASSTAYFTRDDAALAIVVDAVGNTSVTGLFEGKGLVLGTDTLPNHDYPGTGLTAALFAAGYDPYGNVRWTKTDTDPTTAQGFFSGGNLSMDNLGRLYILGSGYGYRTYDNAVINATGTGGRSFLLRLDQPYQRVSGTVYLDENANGYRDANELPFPEPIIVTDSRQNRAGSSFPADGHYNLWLQPGAYQVTVPAPPTHYFLTEGAAGYSGALTAYSNDSDHSFGLAPVPNQPDVRIILTPYTPARPGFITRYRATVKNVGTTVAAPDTVGIRLDSRVNYISSEPVATQYLPDPAYYWFTPALAPFAQREFDLQFSTLVTMPLGTMLRSTSVANLPTDVMNDDNLDTLAQEVTGSFDPNSIEVSYQRLTLSQVVSGQALDYTIRFQNLGTDTAFTVLIVDTLDGQKLKLGTVRYIGSSHSCTWSLGQGGVLRIMFRNIRLPHRDANALRSQGFIIFRIVPQPTLNDGTFIPNEAHITFDFNQPIKTNTAITVIGNANGLPAEATTVAWNLYPNPADQRVTLAATLPTAGPVQVQLLDPLGRTLRRLTASAPGGAFRQELDLTDVAPGLYIVRLSAPDGTTATRRLVRR